MASSRRPTYNMASKSLIEKKRRKSDLVVMWQSFWDVTATILQELWYTLLNLWAITKLWFSSSERLQVQEWLRRYLPQVPDDFQQSWRDGCLLASLLNKLQPGCFPNANELDPDYGLRNVYRCFEVLETFFGIIPNFLVEEIVACVDGSDEKLLDILLQLKQKSDYKLDYEVSIPVSETESHDKLDEPLVYQNCIAKGTGLAVGFVGRITNFIIFYAAVSDLDIVIDIKGPSDTGCSERITKRSPKKKHLLQPWNEPQSCYIRRSLSADDTVTVTHHPKDEEGIEKDESKTIPLEYEILTNQVCIGYRPIERGQHKVAILWHGYHVSDSPYFVHVEGPGEMSGTSNSFHLKSALKSSSIEEKHDPRKISVRFQSAVKGKGHLGKVLKKKVLKYIVNINGKEVPVETNNTESLAPALLKMDYDFNKSPSVHRRNSWGFTGDAERKVSVIRQFCLDIEELEMQSLHRRSSSFNSRKGLRKSGSLNSDADMPERLKTVTEGTTTDFNKCSLKDREDEEAFAFINEDVDSVFDLSDKEESMKYENEEAFHENSKILEQSENLGTDLISETMFSETVASKLAPVQAEISSFSEEIRHKQKTENLIDDLCPNSSSDHPQKSDGELSGNDDIEKELEINEIKHQTCLSCCRCCHSQNYAKKFKKSLDAGMKCNCVLIHSQSSKMPRKIKKKHKYASAYSKKGNKKAKNAPKYSVFHEKSNFVHEIISEDWHPSYRIQLPSNQITEHCIDEKSPENIYISQNHNISAGCRTESFNNRLQENICSQENETFSAGISSNPIVEDVKITKTSSSCPLVHVQSENSTSECLKFYFKSANNELSKPVNKLKGNDINVKHFALLTEYPFRINEKHLLSQNNLQKTSPETSQILREPNQNLSQTFSPTSAKKDIKSSDFGRHSERPLGQIVSTNYLPHTLSSVKTEKSEILKDKGQNSALRTHTLLTLGQYNFKQFNPRPESFENRSPVKNRILQWEKATIGEKQISDSSKLSTFEMEFVDVKSKLSFWEKAHEVGDKASSCRTDSSLNHLNGMNITANGTLNLLTKDHSAGSDDGYCQSTDEERCIPAADENNTGKQEGLEGISTTDRKDTCSSVNRDKTAGKKHAEDKLSLEISRSPNPKRRSFSDPGVLETGKANYEDDFTEELTASSSKNICSSNDGNYLEFSTDEEDSAFDPFQHSTDGEYIDDEIPESATGYWGDLSLLKSMKRADVSDSNEESFNFYSEFFKTYYQRAKSYPSECKVFGIAPYYGYVAVKNRFQILTKGAGCGNLSVNVLGFGRHDVSFASVAYMQKDIYEITYQVMTPGYYLIYVGWMDQPIPGSPFICKVTF